MNWRHSITVLICLFYPVSLKDLVVFVRKQQPVGYLI